MTEEDTFKVLKRIPYEEMLRQLREVVHRWNDEINQIGARSTRMSRDTSVTLVINAHLKNTGWSFNDFFYKSAEGSVFWNPQVTKQFK